MARSPSPCRSSPTERPLPSGPPSPTSPAPSLVLDPFGLNQGSPSSPRSPTLRWFDYRLRNPYQHSCPLESPSSSPSFDPRLPLPRRRPAPKPASALAPASHVLGPHPCAHLALQPAQRRTATATVTADDVFTDGGALHVSCSQVSP